MAKLIGKFKTGGPPVGDYYGTIIDDKDIVSTVAAPASPTAAPVIVTAPTVTSTTSIVPTTSTINYRKSALQNSEHNNWRDAYSEYSGKKGRWRERRNFRKDWKDEANVKARVGENTYNQLRATAEQQQFGNLGYNPDGNNTLTREERRFDRRFNRRLRNGNLKPRVTNTSESTFTKNGTVLYPWLYNYRLPGSVQNTYNRTMNWLSQYQSNLTGIKEGDPIEKPTPTQIDYKAEGLKLLGEKYMTPENLTKIQQFLIGKNYDLGTYGSGGNGVDGKYGQKTNDALVKYFGEVGNAEGWKNINDLFKSADANLPTGDGTPTGNTNLVAQTPGGGGTNPTSTALTSAIVSNTPIINTQNQFDFDNFIKKNNQYEVEEINGEKYLRYNPAGFGDFYVGQNGQIYSSGMFGKLGQALTKQGNKVIFSDGNTFASQGKHLDRFNELLEMINPYVIKNKQGGKMNKIKYFQQGGQMQQDQEELKLALTGYVVATKKQPKSEEEVQQLIQEIAMLKQKDPKTYAQLVQLGSQAQQQQQATMAKWGSKLEYIKSLKYAKGGKTCPTCQQGGKPLQTNSVEKPIKKSKEKIEEKACGGKAKKHYFGGIF